MQEAIRSNWQAERPKVSVSVLVQTDPAELQSQGTQAPGRSDVGVQNEAIDGDDAEDCELADLLEDESNLRCALYLRTSLSNILFSGGDIQCHHTTARCAM